MTPGCYLRVQREAAGLSIEDVARQVFLNPVDAGAAAEALRNAEADRELLGDADVRRLSDVIQVEPRTYKALAGPPCR